MSAAFIGLSCDAAIVRGATGRAQSAPEPNGINIALSGRPAIAAVGLTDRKASKQAQ
jgi:hypothetical protein